MKTESTKNLMKSAITLHLYDLKNYAVHKIANANGRDGQKDHATWCDFYDCLQEAVKATSVGIELPDLTQEMIESKKGK